MGAVQGVGSIQGCVLSGGMLSGDAVQEGWCYLGVVLSRGCCLRGAVRGVVLSSEEVLFITGSDIITPPSPCEQND